MSKRQKELLIKKYEEELGKMLSDADIHRNLGEGKVMKYSELANYNDINELLPNDKDFKIVLTEQQPNSGHWCCLMKYGKGGNIIEWFDPYGVKPDGQFRYINTITKHFLGQSGNPLTKLLKETKRKDQKVYYNKRRFQVIDDRINTCGRWCIARVLAMLVGYELDDFINKVDEKCEETGKPPDILVCDWIK
jgi:hypothetical protein